MTNSLPSFDQRKAACLLFPERFIPSTGKFKIKFMEDRLLFSVHGKFDIQKLLKRYQSAYFTKKINDAKWLESAMPKIVDMCTDGYTPFINFISRDDWVTPPTNDMSIPLDWLGQKIELRFCGKIGEYSNYEVSVTSHGNGNNRAHELGNKTLLELAFEQDEFSEYRLRHMFKNINYETRLRFEVTNGDDNLALHIVKTKVYPIIIEIFSALGETEPPEWYEGDSEGNSRVTRVRTNQIIKKIGSVEAVISLNSFVTDVGENKTLQVDFSLDLEHNMFSYNRALSQIRAIEAMNLFLVRCKQLIRENTY